MPVLTLAMELKGRKLGAPIDQLLLNALRDATGHYGLAAAHLGVSQGTLTRWIDMRELRPQANEIRLSHLLPIRHPEWTVGLHSPRLTVDHTRHLSLCLKCQRPFLDHCSSVVVEMTADYVMTACYDCPEKPRRHKVDPRRKMTVHRFLRHG